MREKIRSERFVKLIEIIQLHMQLQLHIQLHMQLQLHIQLHIQLRLRRIAALTLEHHPATHATTAAHTATHADAHAAAATHTAAQKKTRPEHTVAISIAGDLAVSDEVWQSQCYLFTLQDRGIQIAPCSGDHNQL